MQILIPDSWLRDYLDTDATPKQVQESLSLCGPSVERLHQINGDHVYDIEVTTNRVDMMSIVGIATECVAILPRFGYKAKLKKNPYLKKTSLVISSKVNYLKTKVDKNLCDRFSAVLIRNVQVGNSPELITKRLELAGLRSLNNVVDISNYLMIEMGQPVHTFDYDKIINSEMILRASKKGERLITLDDKSYSLPGEDIVIEDGSGKIIDLCGIMGGANSAVDINTKNVLLFVQVYKPDYIRRTSMRLAHRTNAAALFEKGLPVENVLPTLELGIKLFAKFANGRSESKVLDILNISPKNSILKLKSPLTKFVNSRLGISLNYLEISKILKSLGFIVKSEKEVQIPWVRTTDITIPEDLVEEVARIYGYHNLPTKLMTGELPTQRDDKEFAWISKIKNILKHWGFTEVYTYSLTSKDSGLKLKNPLSEDWKYLRTSLWPSIQSVVQENIGRTNELNIFEIANVYIPQKNNLPKEELHLIVSKTNKDWFTLKGIVEGLFNFEMGITVPFNENKQVFLLDNCIIFEIELISLINKANSIVKYQPISKFSPLFEDFNITITKPYFELINDIRQIDPKIVNIELIDKYNNKLTLRLTFHDPAKQLRTSDITPLRAKLLNLS